MINFNKKDSVASAVDSILKKEEVEQIDELKKSTLSSYVKKAAKDTAVHGFAIGDSIANKKWKTGAKAGDMADKRIKGIGKATDRLAKEEVESVEEALKGNQHKIDKNKNNKIDAQDFKILRGKKSLKKFKEEHDENSIIDQMINEVLSKDASAGDWIHDFVHSDNPKFAGKSKAKRKEMALGAYYAKQRNEEAEQIDEVSMKTAVSAYAKRTDNAQEHGHSGDDEGSDRESKKADKLHGQIENRWGKKGTKAASKAVQYEEAELEEALKGDQHKIDKNKNKKIDAEDFKLLRKEDAVQEGWDDMVKSATEKVKSGPKPSGGSGIKQGTRYGGGKQKDEPEKKEVKEAKQPDQDNVPFAPPYNTSSSPANVKDKSGATHTPMSRVKHIARQAMKKVKSNLGK